MQGQIDHPARAGRLVGAVLGLLLTAAGAAQAQSVDPASALVAEQALVASGYMAGPADEYWDGASVAALAVYLQDWQLPGAEVPDTELLAHLTRTHPDSAAQWTDVGVGCHVWNPFPQPRETITWTGGCKDNTATGFGVMEWRSMHLGAWSRSKYVGNMQAGQPEGEGRYSASDGLRYEGTWVKGAWHGLAVISYPDGSVYEGSVADGLRAGNGVLTLQDGSTYLGNWHEDLQHGVGIFTFVDGSRYQGEWANGAPQGYGAYIGVGGVRYEGSWQGWLPDGDGTAVADDGEVYGGTWTGGCFLDDTRRFVLLTTEEACGF